MNNERVMFTLGGLELYKSQMKELLVAVFGLYYPSRTVYCSMEDIDIVCRLDQFARFIIMRNSTGMCNKIKCLNAKVIIDPEIPQRRIFNVSANQNKENVT